jgi:hypothetical protein
MVKVGELVGTIPPRGKETFALVLQRPTRVEVIHPRGGFFDNEHLFILSMKTAGQENLAVPGQLVSLAVFGHVFDARLALAPLKPGEAFVLKLLNEGPTGVMGSIELWGSVR